MFHDSFTRHLQDRVDVLVVEAELLALLRFADPVLGPLDQLFGRLGESTLLVPSRLRLVDDRECERAVHYSFTSTIFAIVLTATVSRPESVSNSAKPSVDACSRLIAVAYCALPTIVSPSLRMMFALFAMHSPPSLRGPPAEHSATGLFVAV